MDDNRRRLTRHGLSVNLEVNDAAEDCCIGKLVNIHQQGLMIMSNRLLPNDKVYQLELVQGGGAEKKIIPLSADTLWQSPANSDNCFWVGFKIVEISQSAEKAILNLIEQYAS